MIWGTCDMAFVSYRGTVYTDAIFLLECYVANILDMLSRKRSITKSSK